MADGMFDEHAYLYDLIYDSKDYEAEAQTLRAVLDSADVPRGAEVLEAACGTGTYLEYLREDYEVAGFDLSPAMIELGREKLGDVELFVADMTEFQTETPVDALLCLFSSIGYIHGIESLEKTLRNFYRALKPGGVLVVEPWVTPDKLAVGQNWMQTYADDECTVCRQVVIERDDRRAVLDFHWLIAEKGVGVEHLTDLHELYMYTHEEYVGAFGQAGFDVEFDEEGLTGRGLYIARR